MLLFDEKRLCAGKLLIPGIPFVGVLIALGAFAYCGYREVPLPEGTWLLLSVCVCITAINLYLLHYIKTVFWEEARRQGQDPAHVAVEKQYLFAGLLGVLLIVAFAVEIQYIRDTEKPYGQILAACAMVGAGIFVIWFLLTDHEELWDAYRQVISGNSPFGPNPKRWLIYPFRSVYGVYHWMPARVLMGICGLLTALAGLWVLWSEPYAVVGRAQGGSAYWQYEAGELYFHGEGLPKDRARAFALYLAAARQEFRKAYWPVGRMYSRGDGTEQNPAEAVRWLRKAAEEAGGLDAWNLLGLAYGNAEGVDLDPEEAARCFARAAEGEHADGQENLGIAYEVGFGLPEDLGLALYWYERAAVGGNKTARERAEALRARGVRPQKPHAGKS